MNIVEAATEWQRRRRVFHSCVGHKPIALIRRTSWPDSKIGCESGMYEMVMWQSERGGTYHGCAQLEFPEDLLADDWEVVDFPLGRSSLYDDPDNIRPENER